MGHWEFECLTESGKIAFFTVLINTFGSYSANSPCFFHICCNNHDSSIIGHCKDHILPLWLSFTEYTIEQKLYVLNRSWSNWPLIIK